MTLAVGQPVRYHALDGGCYDATVTGLDWRGLASIAIAIPGVGEPWPLTRVRLERLTERPQEAHGAAEWAGQ